MAEDFEESHVFDEEVKSPNDEPCMLCGSTIARATDFSLCSHCQIAVHNDCVPKALGQLRCCRNRHEDDIEADPPPPLHTAVPRDRVQTADDEELAEQIERVATISDTLMKVKFTMSERGERPGTRRRAILAIHVLEDGDVDLDEYTRVVNTLRSPDALACRHLLPLVDAWHFPAEEQFFLFFGVPSKSRVVIPLFDYVTSLSALDVSLCATLTRHLCEALAFLHERSIVHGGVRPENLLVDVSKEATAGQERAPSLRLASFCMHAMRHADPPPPVQWSAPEMLLERTLGPSVDMWGVGLVSLVLLTGHLLAPGVTGQQVRDAIFDARVSFNESAWDTVSFSARNFTCLALQRQPRDRLTAELALAHPYLRSSSSSSSKRRKKKAVAAATATTTATPPEADGDANEPQPGALPLALHRLKSLRQASSSRRRGEPTPPPPLAHSPVIFTIARPGGGKSEWYTQAREMCRQRDVRCHRFDDVRTLKAFARGEEDGHKYVRPSRDGQSFEIIDYSVFNVVLKRLAADVRRTRAADPHALCVVEFARSDNLNALIHNFPMELLDESLIVYLNVSVSKAIERTQRRVQRQNRSISMDHRVDPSVITNFYNTDDRNDLVRDDRLRVVLVDNDGDDIDAYRDKVQRVLEMVLDGTVDDDMPRIREENEKLLDEILEREARDVDAEKERMKKYFEVEMIPEE